jgi:hypothetical protein
MQTLRTQWYFSHFRQQITLLRLQSCKKTASAMPILSPTPFQTCLCVGLLSRDAPADIAQGDISPPILDKIGFKTQVNFAASVAPQQSTESVGGSSNKCIPSLTHRHIGLLLLDAATNQKTVSTVVGVFKK